MKLKVEVDLEDLYLDEETINESVKKAIVNSIVYETQQKVKKQIEEMLDVSIRQIITDKIGELTRKIMLEKFDENAEIIIDRYNSKTAPIKDYVSQAFAESFGRFSMSDVIKSECERIGKELRNRYDMQFAALIVDNLRKQQLLSDDRIAELLKHD